MGLSQPVHTHDHTLVASVTVLLGATCSLLGEHTQPKAFTHQMNLFQ